MYDGGTKKLYWAVANGPSGTQSDGKQRDALEKINGDAENRHIK
jgi:hypothetical protein